MAKKKSAIVHSVTSNTPVWRARKNRKRNGTSGSHVDHLCVFSKQCGNASDGTLNEDCSSALLEFASGAHGVYTQVFYARRDAGRRGAIVSGYDGTVDFDWFRGDLRRIRHHAPFSATESASGTASHFGGDLELARDFIDLIQGRIRTSRTPIATGIQSAYACLAARRICPEKPLRFRPPSGLLRSLFTHGKNLNPRKP